MVRTATAVWEGALKEGSGTLSAPSGVLDKTPYSFHTRFENEPGTNPEELIAAAHAGCFSMALSGNLGKARFTAENIETTASVSLETVDGSPTVTTSHLDVVAAVPGMTQEEFARIAAETAIGCPISRLLKAEITVTAVLRG